jgi:hypothetical protein
VYPQPTGAEPQYGQPGYGQYPGGQQPGYADPAYSQPAYAPGPSAPAAYGPRAGETDQNAIIALVLSVLSWMLCPIVLAIVALVMAGNAQRDIEASHGAKTGLGMVKAARIVSWINIGVYVGGGLLFLIFFVVLAAAGSAGS